MTSFKPMPGATGGHAQTMLAAFLRSPGPVPVHRHRWETPDGDFVDVDQLHAPNEAPHVLVLHGLEGSSKAGYVRETLRLLHQKGFGAVALNFRSCSGEPNRQLRTYNSGDITDARFVISQLRARGITGPLYGVGFSLGGSVLLNLLAKTGDDCPLDGACAISVPFDLGACAGLLDRGEGLTRVYRDLFLATLKAKSLGKARAHPGVLDPDAIRRARGLRAFDDVVTAPLFGFDSADAYYAACSSGPQLHLIRRPTLLITSEDDPLAPASLLPEDARKNPNLSLLITARGGHVGFMSGTPRQPHWWAEEQAVQFFAQLPKN